MSQIRNELRPMNIGDVLDYSVEAFKQNFKGLILLSLILYVPWIVFYSITTSILIDDQMSNIMNMYTGFLNGFTPETLRDIENMQDPSSLNNALSSLMTLLQYLYMITIKLVLNAAVMKMIYDYAISGKVEVNSFANVLKLVRQSFRFLPRMIGNAIVFIIILVAVYILSAIAGVLLLIIPVSAVSRLYIPMAVVGTIAVVAAVIIFLGIILGIGFFWIKFLFGANSIVLENKSFADSFKRSFDLSKGNFWHIGFTSFFGIILYYFIGSMLATASMFTAIINKNLFIALYTFSQLSNALFEPFIIIFITILFVNVKVKKEGLDLEVKVGKLIEEDRRRSNNTGGEAANA